MQRLIGALRTLDPAEALTSEEATIIQTLCANLKNKENVFRDFDSFDQKLVYTNSRQACGDEAPTKEGPFSVEVEVSGLGFIFKSLGTPSAFSNVVTANDPIMSQVCSHVADALEDEAAPARAILNGGSPLWLTGLSQGNPACVNGDNADCLYIERGLRLRDNQYRIEDVKFFAVNGNVGDELRGMVIDRRQMRSCQEEGFSEIRMSFVELEN